MHRSVPQPFDAFVRRSPNPRGSARGWRRGGRRSGAGALALAALLLAGCTAAPEPGSPARPRLTVLTTIAPITLFTRAVAGDCAEVRSLLPAGSGPHDVQSRPQDLLALRHARLLVINGLGLEAFLAPLLRSAAPTSLRVIDSSRGVATLAAEGPASGSLEQPGGDLDHGPGEAHAHGEGHGHGEGHARGVAHAHGAVNPHIWLDPLRAVQQVETIRDALIATDPGCADGYRRRATAYTAQLRRLDAELAARLAPLRGRSFVVLHDFAPYFAARYGLRAEFLVETPQQAPSAADLRRVSEVVRGRGIRVLLSPPGQSSRVFETLAGDLGVQVAVFSPLEVLSEAELADPDHYAAVLRRNAAALIQAFRS